MVMEWIAERFNYVAVIILMMTGLYIVIASGNLIKKLMGLSVFQTSVFLLYITMGKVRGGLPPIVPPEGYVVPEEGQMAQGAQALGDMAQPLYSNPLPHVLILTAIVVGVATLSVGLALAVRIREVYGSIEEDDIDRADYAEESPLSPGKGASS